MNIRGLTLWQPYASLIAVRAKRVETRSWGTSYRGVLLIHAAKRWNRDVADDCRRCQKELRSRGWDYTCDGLGSVAWRDTLGCVVAVAHLHGCAKSISVDDWSDLETIFGDLSPGRWAWQLDRISAIRSPIPWRGGQGLWNVPDELVWAVCEQISIAEIV